MNEQIFISAVNQKSRELNLNPLLLLSGIEGLYTFRDVELNALNQEFLDSLILTIFTLRIGDKFHELATEDMTSSNSQLRIQAGDELSAITETEIENSENPYLKSFANVLKGKSTVRRYHIKALEVAALEIRKAQLLFKTTSISAIMLAICNDELREVISHSGIFS